MQRTGKKGRRKRRRENRNQLLEIECLLKREEKGLQHWGRWQTLWVGEANWVAGFVGKAGHHMSGGEGGRGEHGIGRCEDSIAFCTSRRVQY
jgi:hypothetical protein